MLCCGALGAGNVFLEVLMVGALESCSAMAEPFFGTRDKAAAAVGARLPAAGPDAGALGAGTGTGTDVVWAPGPGLGLCRVWAWPLSPFGAFVGTVVDFDLPLTAVGGAGELWQSTRAETWLDGLLC